MDKYSINDWFTIQTRKDVQYLRRSIVRNPVSLSIFSEVFIAILSLVVEKIWYDDSASDLDVFPYWCGVTILLFVVPTVIFLCYRHRLAEVEKNRKIVPPIPELIDLFDNEICYNVINADAMKDRLCGLINVAVNRRKTIGKGKKVAIQETYNLRLSGLIKGDYQFSKVRYAPDYSAESYEEAQEPSVIRFYYIETGYYLDKAISQLLLFDKAIDKIVAVQEKALPNKIAGYRILNVCSIVDETYSELEKLSVDQRFKEYYFSEIINDIKDDYSAFHSMHTRLKSVIDKKEGTIHVSDNKETMFGTYAGEGIVWNVLYETKDSMLLISKNVLEGCPFSKKVKLVTWENCTLRKWLNEKFYDQVFNEGEKKHIKTTVVKTPSLLDKGTDEGYDTEDRIFVLSIDEANRYFPTAKDRTSEATEHATHRVCLSDQYGKNANWWLRTMKESDNNSVGCVVLCDGTIGDASVLNKDTFGVRPAMWISKDAVRINDSQNKKEVGE